MYSLPSISASAINLAKRNDALFGLIKDAVSIIAHQEIGKIEESTKLPLNLKAGDTLTENDILTLNSYFFPVYLAQNVLYLQKLASRIIANNEALNQVSNVVRNALIYRAYLNFINENGDLKIKPENEDVTRDIVLEDVLNSVVKMLSKTSFIDKLQEQIPA